MGVTYWQIVSVQPKRVSFAIRQAVYVPDDEYEVTGFCAVDDNPLPKVQLNIFALSDDELKKNTVPQESAVLKSAVKPKQVPPDTVTFLHIVDIQPLVRYEVKHTWYTPGLE